VTDRFTREGTRHRFTARRAMVTGVHRVQDGIVRTTLSGSDVADFASTGPADHVRVYFPDPVTGELVAPTATEDGIERPTAPTFARDFTPLRIRTNPSTRLTELDVDLMLHENPGPASLWAERAAVGDQLVLVGPKGSRRAPQDATRLILVCDETALPSATRWIHDVPAETEIVLVAKVARDAAWVTEYLAWASRADLRAKIVMASDAEAVVAAVESVGPIDESTFVFAAAEATSLVPLRRHLRRTLRLPAEQVAISGYWRRDVVGFDHHSPVDPTDPD
jgi:NADPH-dependent ferric siderophore reductase